MKRKSVAIRVRSIPLGWAALSVSLWACGEGEPSTKSTTDTGSTEWNDTAFNDTGTIEDSEPDCTPVIYEPYPFITDVIEVNYGEGAGFGQESMPDIVLGPPMGGGDGRGSLDVLTLGSNGSITVAFDGVIIDEDGPDLIVFENPFIGWLETGIVSASQDGETWYTWDCDAINQDESFPGCAGVQPVHSHPDNCMDARHPELAGGDAFDLSDIGLESARYIRVVDSGANVLGGFDLDAIVVVHLESSDE